MQCEIWEVTDQQISTGIDFLSRISTDFFIPLLWLLWRFNKAANVRLTRALLQQSPQVPQFICCQLKISLRAKSRMCNNVLRLFSHGLRAVPHK